ncbi:MAG: dihydrofolate reductase [Proteobacteria bacterium]|nr:dihydrofolate reductase [Pseudomonadota bacterium]
MPKIILIAAVARNRVIGRDNQLIWHLPEDMAYFKAATAGHTVLMGRKTWDSLPPRFRPLPGRRNIVLTRQSDFIAEGAEIFDSLPAALVRMAADEVVFVIGGADLYAQTLSLAERLMLTEIELEPEGDALFPPVSQQDWRELERIPGLSADGTRFFFVTYGRTQTAG